MPWSFTGSRGCLEAAFPAMPAVTARTVNSCKSQLGNLGINLNNAAQTHGKGSSTSCTLSGKAHKWYFFPPPFPPKDYPPAPHSLHGTGVCHWKEDIQFYQKLPTATLSFQVKHCHHVTHKQDTMLWVSALNQCWGPTDLPRSRWELRQGQQGRVLGLGTSNERFLTPLRNMHHSL